MGHIITGLKNWEFGSEQNDYLIALVICFGLIFCYVFVTAFQLLGMSVSSISFLCIMPSTSVCKTCNFLEKPSGSCSVNQMTDFFLLLILDLEQFESKT